jgi:hypothetical protein
MRTARRQEWCDTGFSCLPAFHCDSDIARGAPMPGTAGPQISRCSRNRRTSEPCAERLTRRFALPKSWRPGLGVRFWRAGSAHEAVRPAEILEGHRAVVFPGNRWRRSMPEARTTRGSGRLETVLPSHARRRQRNATTPRPRKEGTIAGMLCPCERTLRRLSTDHYSRYERKFGFASAPAAPAPRWARP